MFKAMYNILNNKNSNVILSKLNCCNNFFVWINEKERQIPAGGFAFPFQFQQVDIMQFQFLFHLVKSKEVAFILYVVSDSRRKGPWLAYGNDYFSVDYLNKVVQGIVLKNHRQPVLITEKGFP